MAEVIVALELPAASARRLLDRVPEARWVKVGSILFGREGPGFVRELVGRGLHVFLDLKWHDIPNTVAGAVESAGELGVRMASVHILGGGPMLEAAVRAAAPGLHLVGVTVLTAHDAGGLERALGRTGVVVLEEVRRLAKQAAEAGLRGVVCATQEARDVRAAMGPDPWIVVPGIRLPGDPAGDQARTATPAEAVEAGATHLVVGRPILQSADPAEAFRRIKRAG